MKTESKKHIKIWIIVLFAVMATIVFAAIFSHFGGFGTGKSGNSEEFAKYAGVVSDIAIPDDVKIIALGEATHGNVEFQQLKLEVFRVMVEKYDIKAFALEGDYGGCEQVNRYIHGGNGTSEEAAADIGFAIYRTKEMAELISYMKEYNDTAEEGKDLRFYGFDMQRCGFTLQFLIEECKTMGIDTTKLESLVTDGDWNSNYDNAERKSILSQIKEEVSTREKSEQAMHYVDMLLQNCELQNATTEYSVLRDQFMADNINWISEQEREKGFSRIFISGHDGHVAKWATYKSTGMLLSEELGDKYYAIGTDFFKTNCNLPNASTGERKNHIFYSHDVLAKTAKNAGYDTCWIDFAKISDSSEMTKLCLENTYMGSLGEDYSIIMRVLPQSYRIHQPPENLYNGMIFVSEATPTEILEKS